MGVFPRRRAAFPIGAVSTRWAGRPGGGKGAGCRPWRPAGDDMGAKRSVAKYGASCDPVLKAVQQLGWSEYKCRLRGLFCQKFYGRLSWCFCMQCLYLVQFNFPGLWLGESLFCFFTASLPPVLGHGPGSFQTHVLARHLGACRYRMQRVEAEASPGEGQHGYDWAEWFCLSVLPSSTVICLWPASKDYLS